MTSQVVIKGPQIVARALLDSGASMSLVSNRVAQTLQLPKTSTLVSFSGAQATPLQGAQSVTALNLCPTHSDQPVLAVTVAIVTKVTCDLPLQGAAHVREMPHIHSLQLADPTFHLPGRVDLLLGCDVIPEIMLPNHITGPKQAPMACSIVFGWAVLGKSFPRVLNNLLMLSTQLGQNPMPYKLGFGKLKRLTLTNPFSLLKRRQYSNTLLTPISISTLRGIIKCPCQERATYHPLV